MLQIMYVQLREIIDVYCLKHCPHQQTICCYAFFPPITCISNAPTSGVCVVQDLGILQQYFFNL